MKLCRFTGLRVFINKHRLQVVIKDLESGEILEPIITPKNKYYNEFLRVNNKFYFTAYISYHANIPGRLQFVTLYEDEEFIDKFAEKLI